MALPSLCPACGSSTATCPRCHRRFVHGEIARCSAGPCADPPSPLWCGGCGKVVADTLRGIVDRTGALVPYRRGARKLKGILEP